MLLTFSSDHASLYILPSGCRPRSRCLPRIEGATLSPWPCVTALAPMRDGSTAWLVSSGRDGVLVYVVVSNSIGLDEWIRVKPCKIRESCVCPIPYPRWIVVCRWAFPSELFGRD